jgi:hypothetical protein
VMEYIEGVTLEAKLRERNGQPLDVVQVVNWGVQLANVLGYLHEQQPPIIFRDLKPGNIMVQADRTIRLIDFGIARRFQKGAQVDTDSLGSIGYSPPEQFGERQTDPRSDVYSLGATLHQLLTGRHPSTRPFKFAPARELNPAVPASLSNLLDRCLAENPKSRPGSMAEVSRTLEAVRGELPAAILDSQAELYPSARLFQSLSGSTSRLLARNRPYLAPAGLTLLGLGVLTYFLLSGLKGPKTREPGALPGTGAPTQPVTNPPGTNITIPDPQPETPPLLPTTGYVALALEEGLSNELDYRFVSKEARVFPPQPLPTPDANGVTTLAVPGDYIKADATLELSRKDSDGVIRLPLKELHRRYEQAMEWAVNPPNLLQNGDFRGGNRLWTLETQKLPARLAFRPVEPVLAAKGVEGQIAVVTLDASEAAERSANLVQANLFLVESGTYRLRFWARSDSERNIGASTRLNTLGGGTSGLDTSVALSVRWQSFDLPFNVSVPVSQRQKQQVVFRFTPPEPVQNLYLAGTFNGWNFKANPLTRLPDGKTWEAKVPLEEGIYEYKFVTDAGKWFADPGAPEKKDNDGNINSLRHVPTRPARHRLSFMLGETAGRVHLAGVEVKPEGATIPKFSPESNRIQKNVKASDFRGATQKGTL